MIKIHSLPITQSKLAKLLQILSELYQPLHDLLHNLLLELPERALHVLGCRNVVNPAGDGPPLCDVFSLV
jgi:hypothetical protein